MGIANDYLDLIQRIGGLQDIPPVRAIHIAPFEAHSNAQALSACQRMLDSRRPYQNSTRRTHGDSDINSKVAFWRLDEWCESQYPVGDPSREIRFMFAMTRRMAAPVAILSISLISGQYWQFETYGPGPE